MNACCRLQLLRKLKITMYYEPLSPHYRSYLHRTADNSTQLSCLASQKLQHLICHIYNYCTVVLTEYDQHCGGREERKSTLPPWLTPFMVTVMHQRKGRLLDGAKLPFSREHSPALKALLLSLSFHSDPTQPEELHPVHSPPRTSPRLLRHPEKGEEKEAGGGSTKREVEETPRDDISTGGIAWLLPASSVM